MRNKVLLAVAVFLLSCAQVKADDASIWPVDTGVVTSGVGYRKDPFTGQVRFHSGWDIAVPTGTPVYATAPGKVIYAARHAGYGVLVILDHLNGNYSLYAHLSRPLVKEGAFVSARTKIALSGNSGRSTSSHLHYEIRVASHPPAQPAPVQTVSAAPKAFDPVLEYLDSDAPD